MFPSQSEKGLLFPEGHTVGALVNSGVCLVGADQNFLQRAVVCFIAVMGTLLHGALNAFVCVAVHIDFLLFFDVTLL